MLETDHPVKPAEQAVEKLPIAGAAFSTGLIACLAAITMLFAAFSSAYIVRRGLSSDWRPLELPHIVWVSPVAMVVGAAALRWGLRRSAVIFGTIAGTTIVESCRELSATRVSAEASAAAAFFYIFSGGFLLCLVAGLTALLRGGRRSTGLYWRYLAGLWIWLLLLLEIWR